MSEKNQKQHWLPASYIRKFSYDIEESREKRNFRVYALNRRGKIEPKRIRNLCQEREYNSTNNELESFEKMKSGFQSMKFRLEQSSNTTFEGTNQKVKDIIDPDHLLKQMIARDAPSEIKFSLWEREFSKSINKILESHQTLQDIINIKWLMVYILSSQPSYRVAITRNTEESISIEDRIKGKGFLTELGLTQTLFLLLDWDYYIMRVKPTCNKQFITSDNPVHIQYTKGAKFEGGWRLDYTDSGKVKGGESLVSITIPHDAIFFIPLNPLTGFYLYKDPNKRKDIVSIKNPVEKMNISQIRESKEHAFSKDEIWLKSMYEESLDFSKG